MTETWLTLVSSTFHYNSQVGNSDKRLVDGQGFKDVENFVCGELSKTTRGRSSKSHDDEKAGRSPQPLDNGKWACNHRCKDKKA